MKLSITRFITLTAINAALYATVGYITYLGIFAPVFGVVRFWPSVIIPAAFSVLFHPLIGGVGAAIGIFISDLLIHGNAVLSITVGVPANFVGFYLIGYLERRKGKATIMGLIIQIIPVVIIAYFAYLNQIPLDASYVLAGACIVSLIVTVIYAYFKPAWRSFIYAASAGLLTGSLIIGFGVWGYSQFFMLPTGEMKLPIIAAVAWFIWTYASEIPFLLILTPPIIRIARAAGVKALEKR